MCKCTGHVERDGFGCADENYRRCKTGRSERRGGGKAGRPEAGRAMACIGCGRLQLLRLARALALCPRPHPVAASGVPPATAPSPAFPLSSSSSSCRRPVVVPSLVRFSAPTRRGIALELGLGMLGALHRFLSFLGIRVHTVRGGTGAPVDGLFFAFVHALCGLLC